MKISRRLKILIISVWYPSQISPSYGAFVKEFAGAISSFAETVVLNVIPVDSENYGLLGLHDDLENGIRVVRIYFKKVFLFRKLIGFFKYFKGIKYLKGKGFKPDLINAHVYYSALPAILSRYTKKTPLIVTEHLSDFLRKKGIGFPSNKIYKWTVKRAKLVMPVSMSLQKVLKSYSNNTDYKVFPNIFDPEIFYYKNNSSVNKVKKLLFVGALIPRKGIDFLLDVFSKIGSPDILLYIVGEGPEREKYEQLAVNLGVSERVVFFGHKDHKEIAGLMRKSDIYVHGSRNETFGCVLMEAMACGLPVVAASVGGIPEVVDENSGILVDFGDVEAFKEAILAILSNPGRFNRAQIAEQIFNRFSREIAGEKLEEIFMDQINSSLIREPDIK